MKTIELTKGAAAIVDDEDYEELSKYNWYLNSEGYAVRSCREAKSGPKKIRMHRQIMGTPEGMDTDHVNRNRLDNRRSNLRVCTRSENLRNTSLRSDNTTGYKGVSFHKFSKLYHSEINVNKKVVSLGYYKTPEDAARAYNEGAIKYFGEFARLNDV